MTALSLEGVAEACRERVELANQSEAAPDPLLNELGERAQHRVAARDVLPVLRAGHPLHFLTGKPQGLVEQLQLTLVVIEHDIPLIMGLADRVVAMDAGEVLAEGTPEVVRSDPRVIEVYLGGSLAAIERSGVGT